MMDYGEGGGTGERARFEGALAENHQGSRGWFGVGLKQRTW